MNIAVFIKRVREMRKAQREYFRWRTQGWLQQAKENERAVDDMLDEYYNEQSRQQRFDF